MYALAFIGAICVAALVLHLLWPILLYFVLRIFLSKRGDLKKAGEWAIITGATDGIGKAFAEQLAKDGLNIMLISRTQEKLQAVAKALETEYNVKTKIFVADCAKVNLFETFVSIILMHLDITISFSLSSRKTFHMKTSKGKSTACLQSHALSTMLVSPTLTPTISALASSLPLPTART